MTSNSPTIDLNCDVGEGAADDARLIPLVTSVNIACGAHAGNTATMAATVAMAREHGVAVGAHPGHRDREHFGRRKLAITAADAATLVAEQVAVLADVAGASPDHVKLHGGLYHQVAHDLSLAHAVCERLASSWPTLPILLPAGSPARAIAKQHGLVVLEEAFADRAYTDDGSLLSRDLPGSVLADAGHAAARAVRLIREGVVTTASGRDLPLRADTLCIHGDSPHAADLLRVLRSQLTAHQIRVARPPH